MRKEALFQFILGRMEFLVAEPIPVAYGGEEAEFPPEREMVKAHLVVELLERLGYPLSAVQVNQFVETEKFGFRVAEVVASDRRHLPSLLCSVEASSQYEERKETALQDLYIQAIALNKENSLRWLAYYTRWYQHGNLRKKHIVIDYRSFPTFALWQEAGRPTRPSIPSYF